MSTRPAGKHMDGDILIRLRRAYDETGNAVLGEALNEIARLRATLYEIKRSAQSNLDSKVVRTVDVAPRPRKGR